VHDAGGAENDVVSVEELQVEFVRQLFERLGGGAAEGWGCVGGTRDWDFGGVSVGKSEIGDVAVLVLG